MLNRKAGGLINRLFGRSRQEIAPENRPVLVSNHQGVIPDYSPDFVDICFCGSGKFFKDCCGSREEKREPPYGVFVFPNFVDQSVLSELRQFADQQTGEPLMVIDSEKSTPDKIVKKMDDRRVSEYVNLKEYFNTVNQIICRAYMEIPPKYFHCEVEWYERPHLMRYRPGGYYQGHADSENMDPKTRCWHKVIDRDLSVLFYLNDDYEGGELLFNKFNYRLKPKAGMLVMFPSDNRYMHTAENVEEGIRYAVVSWASVKGIKKINPEKTNNIFRLTNSEA